MSLKLSIIIPVYNTAAYLPECLDSVLTQDLDKTELLCINDGSTDNSLEILQKYARLDSRIRIIDKANAGVGAARNDGIRAAQGEYVAFMDSDDYYPNPQVLSRLYQLAKEHDQAICGGHYREVYSDGSSRDCPYQFDGLKLQASGLCLYRDFQFDYGYWAYIYRRQFLRDREIYFPLYSRFQDPPFFVKAMHIAESFYALDEPTYCYRILPSPSKSSLPKTLDMLQGLIDNLKYSRKQHLPLLHYICAQRLNQEASFMAIANLQEQRVDELLAKLVEASALIDQKWLKDNAHPLPQPFVLEVFKYAAETSVKYEKLRQNKVLRILAKLLKR
ncbi:MAG: glycosyltransferase [Lentisphaeria bacterium]|nr:glycosyltransferase [Lentisphaeria bacterium]